MRNTRILAIAGVSLLSIATPAFAQSAPSEEEADAGKEIVVTGTLIRGIAPGGSQTIGVSEEKIAAMQVFARHVVPLFEAGKLRAVVDRVLPLDRAREAHELVGSNDTFGKVVLSV